jgi:hypothetical protein
VLLNAATTLTGARSSTAAACLSLVFQSLELVGQHTNILLRGVVNITGKYFKRSIGAVSGASVGLTRGLGQVVEGTMRVSGLGIHKGFLSDAIILFFVVSLFFYV